MKARLTKTSGREGASIALRARAAGCGGIGAAFAFAVTVGALPSPPSAAKGGRGGAQPAPGRGRAAAMGLTGRDEGAETAKALPPGRLARLSWRPALLAGQGNAVRARNWAGRSLALTTSFYGRSSDNSVEVGPGFRTKGLFVKIEGSGNRVVIGRDVTWSGRISLFGHGLTVMIGDRCDAKGVGITAWEASVAIGRDCLLARGIEIRSSDIHRILDRATGERLNPARDVVIGDGVWIAGQAAILRGARVADGCVVGIRAVVTGAFDEPGCVLAGSPARVVRQGVAWAR